MVYRPPSPMVTMMTDFERNTDWDEEKVTRKIQLLLKKAETTDFPAEAESFYAMAQDLMTRYSIHEQSVRNAAREEAGRPIEEPNVEDWMFASYAHHAQAKQDLLIRVARHNGVHFRTYDNRKNANLRRGEANKGYHESQWIGFIGYKNDIEHTKMMFLSLLIQSTKFATQDWRLKYGEEKVSSWDDGRMGKFAWVSAHMEGFAERIGERFTESTKAVYESVENASALMVDKETNLKEWEYSKGLAVRPKPPVPPVYYCWASEPEENRPFNADGRTKSKKWTPRACIIEVQVGPDGKGRIPHEGEHAFTYRHPKYRYSSYSPKGRDTSSEGRSAGRAAADRADIGGSRPRVGSIG